MDTLNNMERALEEIAAREGEDFRADRETILGRYGRRAGERDMAIKVLSVFGGILATLSFAGFLGVMDLFQSHLALILVGAVVLALALGVQRVFKALVLDTLGVSLYILGMVMVMVGLEGFNVPANTLAQVLFLLALCSLFVTKNYILAFLSVLVLAGVFLYLILANGLPYLVHGYILFYTSALALCLLGEAKFLAAPSHIAERYGPLRIGLCFSLLFGLVLVGANALVPEGLQYPWLSSLAPLATILYLVPSLPKGWPGKKNRALAYGLCTLALLPILFAPAMAGSLLLVLLSFKVNYRTGLVLGIIALAYFTIQYYYDLNLSLLIKSMVLFTSGMVFLLCYLLFTKTKKADEKV